MHRNCCGAYGYLHREWAYFASQIAMRYQLFPSLTPADGPCPGTIPECMECNSRKDEHFDEAAFFLSQGVSSVHVGLPSEDSKGIVSSDVTGLSPVGEAVEKCLGECAYREDYSGCASTATPTYSPSAVHHEGQKDTSRHP